MIKPLTIRQRASLKALEQWTGLWEQIPRSVYETYLTDVNSARFVNERLNWGALSLPNIHHVEKFLVSEDSLVENASKKLHSKTIATKAITSVKDMPPGVFGHAEVALIIKSGTVKSSQYYERFTVNENFVVFWGIYRVDSKLLCEKTGKDVVFINKVT